MARVVIDKQTAESIDVTCWVCFGSYPDCKQNCPVEILDECQLSVAAGDALPIMEEKEVEKGV